KITMCNARKTQTPRESYANPETLKIGVIFILLLFIPLANLKSQGCCIVGTPKTGGTFDYGILLRNSFLINAGYEFYRGTKLYNGKERVVSSLMPIKDKKVHNFYIDLSYAPLNRLTLSITAIYTQKIRKLTDVVQKSYGVGDAVILGKFSIIAPNITNQRELTVGLGWKVPIGNSSFRLDGVKLSIDMQPTIGSIDKIIWFYFYQAFLPKPFNFFVSGIFKLNGRNLDGYKLGNEFFLNTGFYIKLNNYLFLTARGRLKYYASDTYAELPVPNTGGQWFFVSPEVIYLNDNVSLRFYLDYPVYLNVKGTQLVPDYIVGLSVGYNLKIK
ncbi:Putative MetA-pathway of phenol degradation, partial [Candidatus Thermokryptus mobilis]